MRTHTSPGDFFKNPTLLMMALGGGNDLVEGGREAGERWLANYMENCYHQPCDEWSADWDLTGAAEDVALLYRIGHELAYDGGWPGWKAGSEFEDLRKRSAAARR